jgi:hypothetical protein
MEKQGRQVSRDGVSRARSQSTISSMCEVSRERGNGGMNISPGTYRTRNGYTAYVWEKKHDTESDKLLWLGTIKNAGISSWNTEGKDFYGYAGFDLIERIDKGEETDGNK